MSKVLNARFAVAPSSSNLQKSRFDMSYNHKTSGNFGDLIPFACIEAMPGDVFKIDTKMLARMSTPLYPVMDNAFIDYYYFFVPHRLVWASFAEFLGENKDSAWVSDQEYEIPHDVIKSRPGSLFDHLGVPTAAVVESDDVVVESPELDITALQARSYRLIWNEWFRNESTDDPLLVNTGDDATGELESYQTLLKVSKFFDQFTSALPAPQAGNAVDIPLSFVPGWQHVVTGDEITSLAAADFPALKYYLKSVDPQYMTTIDQHPFLGLPTYERDGQTAVSTNGVVTPYEMSANDYDITRGDGIVPSNLGFDRGELALNGVSINDLRYAFQLQRLLELTARSGQRLTEIIRSNFGVVAPDARLQRPEYLGGARARVGMKEVEQNTIVQSGGITSPLGRLGAYSKTIAASHDVDYACVEHGYLIGVMCARTAHTYQQGLARQFSRRGRYDIYWPAFAHIGEQPILKREIYALGDVADSTDEDVFGYQEAWYEYRYLPNQVSGQMRSTVPNNFDEWHYADYYTEVPTLSSSFVHETETNVDRTLALKASAGYDQLIFDIQINIDAERPMPLYSTPGLIDHF